MMLCELFTLYRKMRLLDCSPRSVEGYHGTICTFARLCGAEVEQLSDELVTEFLAKVLHEGRSPATVNKHRCHLLALWRFAVKRGLLDKQPDVQKLKEYRRIPECWSIEQMGRLLAAARKMAGYVAEVPAQLWWPGLILTIYDSGLRISPIMKAQRPQLNLAQRWLRIPAEHQKHRADQKFRLHADTIDVLTQICAHREGNILPWPHDKSGPNFQYLNLHYRRVLRRAGLPTTKHDLFHKLRRTSATFVALSLGRNRAQDHLGHAHLSTTMGYLDPEKVGGIDVADVLPRPKLPPENPEVGL